MTARSMAQTMVVIVLCGIALLSTANAESATKLGEVAVTPAGPGYVLVFADEFNGRKVNTALWNYREDRKLLSAQRLQNVSEGNGVLSIALRKQTDGMFAYTGGGIISKRAFRYGYFEVRARTAACTGWHSAFWAMAADPRNTYNAARRTEIDQLEIDSGDPRHISQGVIAWQPAGASSASEYKEVDIGRKVSTLAFDTSAGWHTYGFAWDEQSVRFFVDGRLTDTAAYPARENVHDALNLWLTAIATRKVDDSCLPDRAQFDYVRYYVRDIYVDNDNPAPGSYSEVGHWEDAVEAGFTHENRSRVSRERGATAQWKVKLPADGRYTVYAYEPPDAANDPAARFSVTHAGGRTDVVVDTALHTGWVPLGRWDFRKGDQAAVMLRRSSATIRADAVKFVREEGRP